jgi:hypothetical protein
MSGPKEFLLYLLNQGSGENIYNPWPTVNEAAALYGVSCSTIYRRARSGALEKSKLQRGDGKGMRVKPPGFQKPRYICTDDGQFVRDTTGPMFDVAP